jgi:hypothetical protein
LRVVRGGARRLGGERYLLKVHPCQSAISQARNRSGVEVMGKLAAKALRLWAQAGSEGAWYRIESVNLNLTVYSQLNSMGAQGSFLSSGLGAIIQNPFYRLIYIGKIFREIGQAHPAQFNIFDRYFFADFEAGLLPGSEFMKGGSMFHVIIVLTAKFINRISAGKTPLALLAA